MLSAMYPWRKNVVIVIDIGNSLSHTQLRIAKAVGKMLIASLSEQDWVIASNTLSCWLWK
jgi:hypothetical protein